MCLLKKPTVLHMFSRVCVFLKIALKAFRELLLCILEGLAILMRNFKNVVQNIKITKLSDIKYQKNRESNFQALKTH